MILHPDRLFCRLALGQLSRRLVVTISVGAILSVSACGSTPGNIALGVVGASAIGGNAPGNELQQIYYLGVFDPQEQLPPQVYRVRVHGQASAISNTRFASGWVHANVVDSLGTRIGFDDDGNVNIESAESQQPSFETGRRLMLFGPEGFREAPKDHRLVILMGANPEDFFNAVDQSLGEVSKALDERRDAALGRILFEALTETNSEKERLAELEKDIDTFLPANSSESP